MVLDVTPSDSDVAIRMVLTADSNQASYERVVMNKRAFRKIEEDECEVC